jgi:hypothetical protein
MRFAVSVGLALASLLVVDGVHSVADINTEFPESAWFSDHYICSGEQVSKYEHAVNNEHSKGWPAQISRSGNSFPGEPIRLLLYGPSYLRQVWEHLMALFDPTTIRRLCAASWNSKTGEKGKELCMDKSESTTLVEFRAMTDKLLSRMGGLNKPTTVHLVGGSSITGVVNYEPLQGRRKAMQLLKFFAAYNFTHSSFMEPHPPCYFENEVCVPEGSGPGRTVQQRFPKEDEILQECFFRAAFSVRFGNDRWSHVTPFSSMWRQYEPKHGDLVKSSSKVDPEACGAVTSGAHHLTIPSVKILYSRGELCHCPGAGKDCQVEGGGHTLHQHSPSRAIYAIAERLWEWVLRDHQS